MIDPFADIDTDLLHAAVLQVGDDLDWPTRKPSTDRDRDYRVARYFLGAVIDVYRQLKEQRKQSHGS